MAEIRKAEILIVSEVWKNYFQTYSRVPLRPLDSQQKEPNILGVGRGKEGRTKQTAVLHWHFLFYSYN